MDDKLLTEMLFGDESRFDPETKKGIQYFATSHAQALVGDFVGEPTASNANKKADEGREMQIRLFQEAKMVMLKTKSKDDDEDTEGASQIPMDPGARQVLAQRKKRQTSLLAQREKELDARKELLFDLQDKLPKGVKFLLNENNVPLLLSPTDYVELSENLISSLEDVKNPILKFSEIFAPSQPKIYPPKRKSAVKKKRLESTADVAVDLGLVFHSTTGAIQDPDAHWKLAKNTVKAKIKDTIEHAGAPKISDSLVTVEDSFKFTTDTPIFSPVIQQPWEDTILWNATNVKARAEDIVDDDSSDDSDLVFTGKMHLGTDDIRRSDSYSPGDMHFEKFPLLYRPGFPNFLSGSTPMPSPAPLQPVMSRNHSIKDKLKLERGKKTTRIPLYHLNDDLSKGEWDKNIIWDGTQDLSAGVLENLILDENDEHMIFDMDMQERDNNDDQLHEDTVEIRREARKKRAALTIRKRGMLSANELLVKAQIAELKAVDRFNLSNDLFYIPKASHQTESTTIVHSLPGLKYTSAKTQPKPIELQYFHKPRRLLPGHFVKLIGQKKRHKKRFNRNDIIRHKKDLSAKEGRVVLIEYTEEFPPVITNMGMGAKIRNYYRRKDTNDNHHVAFADGESISLQPEDESPFIADLPPGIPVQSFENNLYKVPIFSHTPPVTDFLLVREMKKTGEQTDSYILREIPQLYTAGQILPLKEVPAPNSRWANQFMKDRLQAYVLRMFKLKKEKFPSEPARLKLTDIGLAFPGQSDNSVRKKLKECAIFKRGGDECGSWLLKPEYNLPSDEVLRSKTPPDDVALYECMLAGAQRLQDIGIERLHHVNIQLHSAVQSFGDGHPLRRAAKLIEEELLLTPWNLTSNFVNAMQGKCLLQLTGFGDPSGRGEAFSFVRQPQKIVGNKKEEDSKSNIFTEKTVTSGLQGILGLGDRSAVTGTDADLRKLSLEHARDLLLEFGVGEDEIASMGRWDRINRVRSLSSEAKQSGENNNTLVKFARGARFSIKHHQEQIKTKLERIFQNQVEALSKSEPPDDSDEELHEEDMSFLDEFEKNLEDENIPSNQKKRPRSVSSDIERAFKRQKTEDDGDTEVEDEDERKAFSEFLKGANAPITKPVPIAETSKVVSLGGESVETGLIKLPHDPAPNQKFYLKRTRTIMDEDGNTAKRIDIITDAEEVKKLLDQQKRQRGAAKRFRLQLSEDEEKKRIIMKKEKRRLQEKYRRQRKIQENQKILQERYKAGSQDGTLPGCNVNLKCGRCGMFGHMKTNKSCPVYVHDEDEEQAEKQKKDEKKPVVKHVKGLRVSVPKQLADKKSTLGKRKKSSEDDGESGKTEDGFKKPKRRRPPAVKQGVLMLSQVLERIWTVINAHNMAEPFRNPVSTVDAYDYYDIITDPIDLSLILKKIKDLTYKSVQAFISDFELMRNNCYKYNQTRYVHLLPAVDELIISLHTEVEKEQAAIREIEAIIERESKSRAKPRQKAKKPTKSKKPKPTRSKKAKTPATSDSTLFEELLDVSSQFPTDSDGGSSLQSEEEEEKIFV